MIPIILKDRSSTKETWAVGQTENETKLMYKL